MPDNQVCTDLSAFPSEFPFLTATISTPQLTCALGYALAELWCLLSLQVKVVNRELVAVLTQATLTDAEMLQAQPDAAYLLSITEQELPPVAQTEAGEIEAGAVQGLTGKSVRIGVCAVDVATARILLGQW